MRARIEAIFHDVADLTDEKRSQYFDRHQIHGQTRKEVAALVACDSDSHTSLDRQIGEVAYGALAHLERSDVACGPYRLGDLLGRGGMGTVYSAERIDGEVEQFVAVKLLHPGAHVPHLRDRFLAERQILATLSHPNIARLLDAGHREDGQPFLVMERVEGEAIDVYTAGHGIKSKLNLLIKVCAAVSYLHRNLVVHRDLKPANILVTKDGEPKLLDFGIAKVLDSTHTLTGANTRILTPDYASPEQILGGPIGTATDIYSLGAVLYNLLTGVSPNQPADNDAAFGSGRLIGKVMSPAKLVPALKGDLEFILLKALRNEPQERYATIDHFAEDLENYLSSRPIRARQADIWYRARKYFRRYWLPGTASLVAVSCLVGGVMIASYQREIAHWRFVQVRELAGRFLELHDDVAHLSGSTQVREKMVATALNYLDSLSLNGGNDPALLSEIGRAYEKVAQAQGAPGHPNLGRTEEALQSFRKALAYQSRAAGLDPAFRLPLASIHTQLAYLSMLHAHLQEARRNIASAAALLDQLRTEKPGDPELLVLAAQVATNRGDLSEYDGDTTQRLAFFRQASQLQDEYVRRQPSNAARGRAYLAADDLAEVLTEKHRYEEALAILRERAPEIDVLRASEPGNPTFLRNKMSAANHEAWPMTMNPASAWVSRMRPRPRFDATSNLPKSWLPQTLIMPPRG